MGRSRKKYNAPKGTTRAKGDILEEIIAEMHKIPGVKIERDVFLPAIDGTGRKREIDVLITSQVAGFPVRIAIECKNEKNTIDVKKIGEFIDKLNDVGLPVQHGIFIATSKYSTGAIQRSNAAGIRTFLLKDISNNLEKTISETFQSVIYLLLTITNIGIVNDVSVTAPWSELLFFRDDDGRLCGSVSDLIWDKWVKGSIDDSIGEHEISLSLPTGWYQIIQGQVANIKSIKVNVKVSAIVVTFPGIVNQYQLVDAKNGTIEKDQINAKFNVAPGKYPVYEFNSEQELTSFLDKRMGIRISIGRFRLPRIRWLSIYWPPSKKTMNTLAKKYIEKNEKSQPFDISSIPLAEIEGDDLSAIWEPIIEDHPMLRKKPE